MELHESKCGCKDEICRACGSVEIINVCVLCYKLHYA